MRTYEVSLLAIISDTSVFEHLRSIFSRWPIQIQIAQAQTLEEVAQFAGCDLDIILIDPFDDCQPDSLAFFVEVQNTLSATPIVCLLPEDTQDYRSTAVKMGANGMVTLDRLDSDLLPLVQSLLSSSSSMQMLNSQFQEIARHSSPVGESAQGQEVYPLNLGTRIDKFVTELSDRAATSAGSSLLSGWQAGASLQHLKTTANSPLAGSFSRTVRTACNHDCGFHYCGMKVTVSGNRITKIEPAEFSDTRYRSICLKGISYVQLISQPSRLLHPLKRKGPRGSGEWEQISWNQAFSEIARKIQTTTAKYGPESTMFLTSKGQAGILNGYFGVYFRLASLLQASAIDPQRLGMDTGVASGIEDTFGMNSGFKSNAFQDLPNSKMILVWGSNPVRSWMPWWNFFLEAKKSGTKIVTIDPRFTATAAKSDIWLSIRPGTDLILALGMINLIIQNNWFDADYILNHTVGPFLVKEDSGLFLRSLSPILGGKENKYLVWDQASNGVRPIKSALHPALRGMHTVNGSQCRTAFDLLAEYAADFTIARVAQKTGLSPEQVFDLTRDYATTRPARIFTTFGIERWGHASTFGRLISTLGALTGNIGIPGGGAGVSGFFEFPLHIGKFATPEGKRFRPVNPAELPDYIAHEKPYPIKAVMVAFCNWFNQTADWDYMSKEVLPKLDLLVVSDLFMTETAKWADYVLPAASLFEREDMVKGPGPFVQYQPQIITPLGECRSDFDIAAGLGRQLGLDEYFCDPPSTYLRKELTEIDSRFGPDDFTRLQKDGVLYRSLTPETLIPFASGDFPTASRRAEFYVERHIPFEKPLPVYHRPIEANLDGETAKLYPLICIFVHSHFRVNSTFEQSPSLSELDPEPYVYMHPITARERQIGELDWVRIFNSRGFVEVKARLTVSIPTGAVYLTSGWNVNRYRAGNPQSLTHRFMDATNALGASMAFSDLLVEVCRDRNKDETA